MSTAAHDAPLHGGHDEHAANASDPFTSASGQPTSQHRYSTFDEQLFSLATGTSPDQAKRALEAHLAETERRIQEASTLGTTLVEQRQELTARLQEVEKHQSESEISPELKKKLADIEKEYNEVGRETARAFLPKQRVPSNEIGSSSPYHPERKRSVSPSKFESQATNSPTKMGVPNRKQRNQPSNRVHDIEFATEIGTSLLSQVRHLQVLLAEKEDTLRAVSFEKGRLEDEVEVTQKRLRTLDESEQRYKDENWNLETQLQEHLASAKESSSREQKLGQSLSLLQAEKLSTQKELDEMKLTHAKLSEDHASAMKLHDTELGSVKRSMAMAENERGALQRKVDELTGQNQELVKAVMASQRARTDEQVQAKNHSDDDFHSAADNQTPENSPPPSPVKATPRHSMLESETLKSSLHHAHRMIQNLKSNIHREKTEKLELKRMLQDARDEIEIRRNESSMGSASRRSRKVESREFKKPPRPGQLGGTRSVKSEIFLEDTNWEDQADISPTKAAKLSETSDHFETANETSDAFETANERATETEDFQTGAEDLSDSSQLTETEGPAPASLHRSQFSSRSLRRRGSQSSFRSTASTSAEEYDFDDVRTPLQQQPQRMRLRVSRGGLRRSRIGSEEPSSSPAGLTLNSNQSTPQVAGQSLFAELGALNSDDDDSLEESPSRNIVSPSDTPDTRPGTARPGSLTPSLLSMPAQKSTMVDSGVMTEPFDSVDTPLATGRDSILSTSTLAEGDLDQKLAAFPTPPSVEPLSFSTVVSEDLEPVAEKFVLPALGVSSIRSLGTEPIDPAIVEPPTPDPLMLSPLQSLETAPMEPIPALMAYSSIQALDTHPIEPEAPEPVPVPLIVSSINSVHSEPIEPKAPPPPVPASFNLSSINSVHLEPRDPPSIKTPDADPLVLSSIQSLHSEPITPEVHAEPPPKLDFSGVASWDVEPIEPALPSLPVPVLLNHSSIQSLHSEPIEPATKTPTPEPLSMSSVQSLQAAPIEVPIPKAPERDPLMMSSIQSLHAAPIEPVPAALSYGNIQSLHTEPILPELPKAAAFAISPLQFLDTEPVSPPSPIPTPLELATIKSVEAQPIASPVEEPELLAFSDISSIDTEPLEPQSHTGMAGVLGGLAGLTGGLLVGDALSRGQSKSEAPETPKRGDMAKDIGAYIAEDETRQSPRGSSLVETPESQRPFKEVVNDSTTRVSRKPVSMADESSQTALTSEQIDLMIKDQVKRQDVDLMDESLRPSSSASRGPGRRGSQDSTGSVRRIRIMPDTDSSLDTIAVKRPTSRSSVISHPPLPPDHKQAIAAATERARLGSGEQKPSVHMPTNAQNPMAPPPIPASVQRGNSLRPQTPTQNPLRPPSVKDSITPRAGGKVDVYSPSTQPRSRRSSVTSFASEVDTRFNLRTLPGAPEFQPGTDPRMIQAITQTMIGEYLWKYTRKPGRGELSGNRHRRFFWVHPYTRTLYWSDRDPASAGRLELKAKSVAIEAVRVVTDDNPMPPGLHRKSLIVLSPGRSIKFTAVTGQRHETWFNALSYLLLRTGAAGQDAEEATSTMLTAEDLEEFNGYGRRSRAAPSLSSYHSRTTRNESPSRRSNRMTMTPEPTLMHGTTSSRQGTLSRISNYWRPASQRSRQSLVQPGSESIYQASEVHDSAEDLREIIEKQDREADRLENVRACCDGKHDVGTLSKRGRFSGTPHRHSSAAHTGRHSAMA